MRIKSPIERPFRDEHVIAVDPPLRPRVEDSWRRRINPFTGRALSHHALDAEQGWRAGIQRLRGQSVTAGVIEGLDLAPEPGAIGAAPGDARFQLLPGSGLARSGEDITVPGPRRLALADLPVFARVDHLDAIASGSAVAPPAVEPPASGPFAGLRPLLPRRIGPPLGEVVSSPEADVLPRAAIAMLEPVTATILAEEQDDCPPDPRDDPYDDLQLIDGARLVLYFWPAEMTAVAGGPDYAMPPAGPAFRNVLAYRVFEAERVNGPNVAHPWERQGLPLALVGFNPDWTLAFVDRAAVARLGGQPAMRTPLDLHAGAALLWQARVAQFAEQMAEDEPPDAARFAETFRLLPPTGFLPGTLVDLVARRQTALPPNIAVTAAPVPLEQLALAVDEAASLDPVDLGQPDSLELLVPVPERLYDPRLLEIEAVDPRFSEAIARFEADRGNWLARRERVRRRCDLLVEARTGVRGSWPAEDSPLAEISPPGTPAPLSAARIRRMAAGAAFKWHAFTGSDGRIRPALGGRLYVWVRVTDRRSFSSLTLRTGTATAQAFDKAVWWGAPTNIPFVRNDSPQDLRQVGDIPPGGEWTRLEVPVDAQWGNGGLAGLALDGFEFGQRGGTVEWGPLGLIDADGRETVYLSEFLPEGSREATADATPGPWPWVDVAPAGTAEEDDYGVVAVEGRQSVAAIRALRSRWPQDFLADDFKALGDEGLESFIETLEGRVTRTNDRIDLSFVRARADIYRLRQFMLGADAASKLVTSPALADLSIREESARARAEDLGKYLQEAYKHSPTRKADAPLTPVLRATDTTGAGNTGGGGTTGGGPAPFLMFQPIMMATGTAAGTEATGGGASPEPFVLSHVMRMAPETAIAQPAGVAAVSPLITARRIQPRLSIAGIGAAFAGAAPTWKDVQTQRPLPGVVERTASVAERITLAPAVEIHDYALEGKLGVVGAVSELIAGGDARTGIALSDLPAPGFRYTPTSEPGRGRRKGTLGDVLGHRGDYDDEDQIKADSARHEADYFTGATRAIDNAIATLRLMEGRVDLYKRLVADARKVLRTLEGRIDEAEQRLRVINVELAEARHDVATARALLAEEEARVAAVNQRRARTIDKYGTTLLFRRPRRTDRMQAVPTAPVAPALAPSPVAACRRGPHAAPPELEDYVALFRDLPARAFAAVAPGIDLIDRLEAARASLVAVRRRAAATPRKQAAPRAGPRFLQATRSLIAGQLEAAENRRLAALSIDPGLIARIDLSAARKRLLEQATLGDLIEGAHGRPDLTRRATAELEAIGDVASCLHAGFSEVAPIVRLGWAEALSQFDRPMPLDALSALPRWGEVDLSLRRELQGLTDWLMHRIDPRDEAGSRAVNELVRIAILMAAHAPVDRLIPARLTAPSPVAIGTLLTLAAEIDLVRVGMTAIVRRDDGRPVLRAMVEDLGDGIARARVTERLDLTVTTLAAGIRVDLAQAERR